MRRIRSPKTQAKLLVSRQRQERVIALLTGGRSQRQVAREVGLTQPRVCQIYQAHLQQIQERSLRRLALHRARQVLRLETMIKVNFPKAIGLSVGPDGSQTFGAPDAAAGRLMLRLMESEARLLGLYAPWEQPVEAKPEPAKKQWDLNRLTTEELLQLQALQQKMTDGKWQPSPGESQEPGEG